MRGHELADRRRPLGDPAALIEEPRGLGERLEIDLDELPAERAGLLDGDLPRGGRLPVIAEAQLLRPRDADPRCAPSV
jgi:hypothetical protein